MRCGGGLTRAADQGGEEGKDLGNPQEGRLVLDWIQVITKPQKHEISGLDDAGGHDWKEEKTWEKRGWVPFDHGKPEGLGGESPGGEMSSSVTVQLDCSGEGTWLLCASVSLPVNWNNHFPQLTFQK